MAGLTTPTFSVVSGGLACIAGALAIGRCMPRLTAWRLSAHEADPEGEVPVG